MGAENELSNQSFKDGHIAGGNRILVSHSGLLGIRTGVDFAGSEEGFALYLKTGTAWGTTRIAGDHASHKSYDTGATLGAELE